MLRTRLLALAVLGLLVTGAAPTFAAWETHTATTYFTADQNNTKHPEDVVHAIVLPNDTDGAVFVCVAYGNNAAAKNAGRIIADVEITRGSDDDTGDGEEGEEGDGGATVTAVETLSFDGKPTDRKYTACQATGGLSAGDTLVFSYRLRNFQRIPKDRPSGPGGFALISAVSESRLGDELFYPPNPGEEAPVDDGGNDGGGDDGGGNDGGGNDGGGDDGGGTSGPLSSADANAAYNVYRQVGGSTGAQVVVSNSGWRLDVRKNGVVNNFPSSGYAGSLASAGTSLCRVFPCGSGSISSTTQKNILRLRQAATSGGRWIIALRLESGGKWYVDFIKGTAPYHGTGYGSDTAAVAAFCASAVVGSAC